MYLHVNNEKIETLFLSAHLENPQIPGIQPSDTELIKTLFEQKIGPLYSAKKS